MPSELGGSEPVRGLAISSSFCESVDGSAKAVAKNPSDLGREDDLARAEAGKATGLEC